MPQSEYERRRDEIIDAAIDRARLDDDLGVSEELEKLEMIAAEAEQERCARIAAKRWMIPIEQAREVLSGE